MRNFLLSFSLFLLCFFISLNAYSQQNNWDNNVLALRPLVDSIFLATTPDARTNANNQFIPALVGLLKTPNSFSKPLDSITKISIITSPDNFFRIITWHLLDAYGTYRHFGCIQMNQTELKLFPLRDNAPELGDVTDTALSNSNWWGAMYYQVVMKKVKRKNYYFMIGWSAHEVFSQKKVIDVLSFNNEQNAVWGAPLFKKNNETYFRIIVEYSKRTAMMLKFDMDNKKLIIDNLIVPHGPDIGVNRVPDGTFNAWVWKKNKWNYQDMIDFRSKADQ